MTPRNHNGRWLAALATGALAAQAQVGWSTDASSPGSGSEFAGRSVGLASFNPDSGSPPPPRVTASRRRPNFITAVPVPPAGTSGGPPGGGSASGPTPQVFSFVVNKAVPDADLSGLADSQVLPPSLGLIQSVAVTLVLRPLGEGGFMGDLYATLTHEAGGYGVLLNRPGRRSGSPFGYSDDLAVGVTLAEDGTADIHQYRLTLTGSELVPLTGTLTGRWQPDGRSTDPLAVLSTDARAAGLASFAGDDPAGLWTLFIADVSGGGEYRLDSWSLSVTPVPEPSGVVAVFALGALAWVLHQRRRDRR